MSKYAIKNVEGAQVAETELADSVFGIEPNISCIHQVVVCQDACKRQGTHSTKNRHDVSGGGAKPTVRRAPAVLVRVPSALVSGPAAA